MGNDRLRAAISGAGLTYATLAERVGVDPKTVERWVTKDRVPHRTHRVDVAGIVAEDETYLWPSIVDDRPAGAELVALYPTRRAVNMQIWLTLPRNARQRIDLLAYAGTFLHDSMPDVNGALAAACEAGGQVRLLFGDPNSQAVALRGDEEGVGDLMSARCRLTWQYYTPILAVPGIQARQHQTTLYNSLFRFDDMLMANVHAYGVPAHAAPVLQLHKTPGGELFKHYMDSFERVWESAEPVKP